MELYGAGGGGGAESCQSLAGFSGGGGAYTSTILTVQSGDSLSVTVGSGGSGGVEGHGVDGGDTQISDTNQVVLAVAFGGKGGEKNATASLRPGERSIPMRSSATPAREGRGPAHPTYFPEARATWYLAFLFRKTAHSAAAAAATLLGLEGVGKTDMLC